MTTQQVQSTAKVAGPETQQAILEGLPGVRIIETSLPHFIENPDRLRKFMDSSSQKELDHVLEVVRHAPERGKVLIVICEESPKPDRKQYRFGDYLLTSEIKFGSVVHQPLDPEREDGSRLNNGMIGKAFILNSDSSVEGTVVLVIDHEFFRGIGCRGAW